MTYRRKSEKGGSSSARPDNLNEPIYNLGEFPVTEANIRRFAYIYDGSRSEYQGHTIHDYNPGDGKKIDVTIPPTMISMMFAHIMATEHPILFHMMLRADYRSRDRPNKFGKLVPKSMVLFNSKATNFGYNRLAQTLSYHGCQLMTKHNVQPFDDNRPGCLDSIYNKDMVDKLHGEVKTKPRPRGRGSTVKPKYGKLGGGSMLLEDPDARKKLKSVMYTFEELVPPDGGEDDEYDDDDDNDENDDDDGSDMDDESDDDDDEDDDDHQSRNERRRGKGKIAKKKKKKKSEKKPKKKPKKRVLPHKQQKQQQVEEEEVEVERVVPAQRREVRQSTTDKTVLSAEKRQQYVRGIAENSKKRKALTEQLESATIPLDDIFGEDDKKPWKEHPKYQDLEVKAKKYVDSLGYSQPNKGASETMHTMAKKLDICLPRSKTPAKPVLTHAIVVQKLRHVDTTAGLKYE